MPDRIISLRVTIPLLLKKPLFDYVTVRSSSDKVDMDNISDGVEN